MGLEYKIVNHSLNFKNPITDVHTSPIEGPWTMVRRSIQQRNKDTKSINEHLPEFVWRKKNKGDEWKAFFQIEMSDFLMRGVLAIQVIFIHPKCVPFVKYSSSEMTLLFHYKIQRRMP